jgi:hypothetical protein
MESRVVKRIEEIYRQDAKIAESPQRETRVSRNFSLDLSSFLSVNLASWR